MKSMMKTIQIQLSIISINRIVSSGNLKMEVIARAIRTYKDNTIIMMSNK